MKFWNFIVLSVLLAILFQIAGVPVTEDLLEYFGLSVVDGAVGVVDGNFWNFLFSSGVGVLAGIGVAALAIGIATKSNPENYIILGLIVAGSSTFLGAFVGIIGASHEIGGWVYYLSLLIMGPLLLGFVVSLVDYFRGTD